MDLQTTVTAGELALVLGLKRSTITTLYSDKVLTRDGQMYPLCENVQRYLQYKVRRAKPSDKAAAEAEKAVADAKYKKAKAEIMELEAAELKGRMHRSEDVEALTSDLIYTIRSVMLALPGRLAVDVAACDNPAEVAQIIRREILSAMEGLGEYSYSPARYAERVRDRRRWEEVMMDEAARDAPVGPAGD